MSAMSILQYTFNIVVLCLKHEIGHTIFARQDQLQLQDL